MNFALTLLTLIPLATPEPSPLDVYRANFASAKVDMTFRYQGGRADPSLVGRLWSLKEPDFDTSPSFGEHDSTGLGRVEITGRWAFDGTTELYEYATPESVLQKIKDNQDRRIGRVVHNHAPHGKALFDGTVFVEHDVVAGRAWRPINVSVNNELTGFLIPGSSPFVWWYDRFPKCLDEQVPGVQPERHTGLRDGHAVVVESYSKTLEKPSGASWRLEISYDPAIGYLPRYARRIWTFDGDAQVVEMYLIEARQCASGGFVPTEWYATRFNVDDFDFRKSPDDDGVVFEPSERISLGHFKAVSFADCTAPVALTDRAGFKAIYSYYNTFLLKPGTTRLTLDDVKARLGPWLNDPTHPRLPEPGTRPPQGPDPDADPLHLRPVVPWPLGAVVILAGTIGLIFRRRSRKTAKSRLHATGIPARLQSPDVT